MLRDIHEGRRPSGPRRFFEFNDQLFFLANDGVHGYEIWTTDGTAANTQLVKDTWPGRDGVIDLGFEVLGDRFYFTANDGEHGMELWESDGTMVGTQRITDIAPGFPTASITHLDTFEDDVIVYVNPGDLPPQTHELTHGIWRWDTVARTVTEIIGTFDVGLPLQDMVGFHRQRDVPHSIRYSPRRYGSEWQR